MMLSVDTIYLILLSTSSDKIFPVTIEVRDSRISHSLALSRNQASIIMISDMVPQAPNLLGISGFRVFTTGCNVFDGIIPMVVDAGYRGFRNIKTNVNAEYITLTKLAVDS